MPRHANILSYSLFFFALRMPRGLRARVMGLILAFFFITQTSPAQTYSGSQRPTLSFLRLTDSAPAQRFLVSDAKHWQEVTHA